MAAARPKDFDSQDACRRTRETNRLQTTPNIDRPKTILTSVYKSFKKEAVQLTAKRVAKGTPVTKGLSIMTSSRHLLLQSMPAKQSKYPALDSPYYQPKSSKQTETLNNLSTIREFNLVGEESAGDKKIIKSKSSVLISQPGTPDNIYLARVRPFAIGEMELSQKMSKKSDVRKVFESLAAQKLETVSATRKLETGSAPRKIDESSAPGKNFEGRATKHRHSMVMPYLKNFVPLRKKRRLAEQPNQEISSTARLNPLLRSSFVQTFTNTSIQPKQPLSNQNSELQESKKRTSYKSLIRPQTSTLHLSNIDKKLPKHALNNHSNDDIKQSQQKSVGEKIMARFLHKLRFEKSNGRLSAKLSKLEFSRASSNAELELSRKAKEYYVKDLEDAFSGALQGYFAEMFSSHLRKALHTFEVMKKMELKPIHLRMRNIFLNSQGLPRPAIPENINIYLNYQTSNRTPAAEPNFYKQSYETMLAKKRNVETSATPRVSSETKVVKRASLCASQLHINFKHESKQSFSTDHDLDGDRPKKTIIFDLDETLIHSCKGPNEKYDRSVIARMPNRAEKSIGFNVRPHLDELLSALKDHFELIIFTASHYCYANPILDDIDPNRYFNTRLFRDHCDLVDNGVFIKNLSILKDRDLKNIVLVDNSVSSFASQVSNGIPIVPFFDNKADDQLMKLKWFLLRLKDCEDVRPVIAEQFDWEGWRRKFVTEPAVAVTEAKSDVI